MKQDSKVFQSHSLLHGLRTPNEAFFHQNPKLLGQSRQFGQINFGALGVFSGNLKARQFQKQIMVSSILPKNKQILLPCVKNMLKIVSFIPLWEDWGNHNFLLRFADVYQHPFLVLWVLVHFFQLSIIISTKNEAFISNSQIYIWDWDLNLGRQELGI